MSQRVILMDRADFRAQRRDRRLRILAGEPIAPAISFTETEFMWECPGCGGAFYGMLGPEPVSGWDSPRWRKTGTEDAPTLEPSLGCPGWRDGTCPGGHYWLRDGELVPA